MPLSSSSSSKPSSPSSPSSQKPRPADLLKWKDKWKSPAIGRLIPNVITLSSLCMGLSAIRFGCIHQWPKAVASVFIAGALDFLDGRIARMLKSASHFGAELDSLGDFINFGVAPALIVYMHCMEPWGRKGWWISLCYASAMAWRLARFNTMIDQPLKYSVGVPAPAGSLMVFTPLIASFVIGSPVSPWLHGIVMLTTAVLLISRIPTFVIKYIVVPPQHLAIVCMGLVGLVAGFFSAPWETMLVLATAYFASIPISIVWFKRKGLW